MNLSGPFSCTSTFLAGGVRGLDKGVLEREGQNATFSLARIYHYARNQSKSCNGNWNCAAPA